MIVWVLLIKVLITAPVTPQVVPYLAFDSQRDCVAVLQTLPEGSKADCVAFAADVAGK
jgi:hypothetical protein